MNTGISRKGMAAEFDVMADTALLQTNWLRVLVLRGALALWLAGRSRGYRWLSVISASWACRRL